MCHSGTTVRPSHYATAQGERYRELGGEIYSGEWEIRGRDTGRYRGYGEIQGIQGIHSGRDRGEIQGDIQWYHQGTISPSRHRGKDAVSAARALSHSTARSHIRHEASRHHEALSVLVRLVALLKAVGHLPGFWVGGVGASPT